jgi:hypothetical protein
MRRMPEIRDIVQTFTQQITAAIETQILDRARSAVNAALGNGATPRPRRGRPPKALRAAPAVRTKPRRKAPKQLCPVPGCKNPAAPVFGMVCAKHKDMPKAKIKQFREARRAKKMKGSGGAGASGRRRGRRAAVKKKARTTKKAAGRKPGAATPPAAAASS